LSTEFESEEGKGSEAFSVIIGDSKKKRKKEKKPVNTKKRKEKEMVETSMPFF
jgi:hypothetical protein